MGTESERQLGHTVDGPRASPRRGIETSQHRFYSTFAGLDGSLVSPLANNPGLGCSLPGARLGTSLCTRLIDSALIRGHQGRPSSRAGSVEDDQSIIAIQEFLN